MCESCLLTLVDRSEHHRTADLKKGDWQDCMVQMTFCFWKQDLRSEASNRQALVEPIVPSGRKVPSRLLSHDDQSKPKPLPNEAPLR